MDPLFQDERISAYLDGELPPAERSQFEDELARNAELRQVVEELRALHDSLQALPRRRLEEDFAQHVLRKAERAMLSESQAIANDGDAVVVHGASAESRRSRRPWIWAAVAIAVAVALMVFNPPAKQPMQVAQRDSAPIAPSQRQNKSRETHEKQIAAPVERDTFRRKNTDNVADTKRAATSSGPAYGFGGQMQAGEELRAAAKSAAGEPRGAIAEQSKHVADRTMPAKQNGDEVARDGVPSPAPLADRPIANQTEGKPQLLASSVDRSAGVKGDAIDFKRFGVASRGLKKPEVQSLDQPSVPGAFASSANSNAHEDLPAKLIVAEYATNKEVSAEALQPILEKRGISLNTSPAANLTWLSAVRSASAGDASSSNAPLAGAPEVNRPAQIPAAAEEPLQVVYVVGSREQVMGLVHDLAQPAEYRMLAVGTVAQNPATPNSAMHNPTGNAGGQSADKLEKDSETGSPLSLDDASSLGKDAGQGEHAASPIGKGQGAASASTPPAAPAPITSGTPALSGGNTYSGGTALGAPANAARKFSDLNREKFAKSNPPAPTSAGGENASDALAGPGGGKQESEKLAAPGSESAAAKSRADKPAAEMDAFAESAEAGNGSAWATRPMPVASPETENALRQVLANRENHPAYHPRSLQQQANQVAADHAATSGRDKDSHKEKSDARLKPGSSETVRRSDVAATGDQVQAVFVFRVMPQQSDAAEAAVPAKGPDKAPAASPAGKAGK